MSTALPPALRGIYDDTLGAAFIGFAVSCILCGILCAQSITYFNRFSSDRLVFKLLVAVVVAFELLDQGVIMHALYILCIKNFANKAFLFGVAPWSLSLQIILGSFVATVVKICFALRVWRFSKKNNFLTGFILIACCVEFAMSMTYTVKCFQLEYFIYLPSIKAYGSAALGTSVVTDIIIAASLCYYLGKLKNIYHHSHIVVHLLVYAINTGVLTSTCSLATLIAYNTMPTNFVFVGLYFILSKLYAISFLAALNTRKSINNRGTERGDSKTNSQGSALQHPRIGNRSRTMPERISLKSAPASPTSPDGTFSPYTPLVLTGLNSANSKTSLVGFSQSPARVEEGYGAYNYLPPRPSPARRSTHDRYPPTAY